MAGLGGKNWTFQEEVTSSDVNGYLADQVVMRFGGTANRDAGFGGAGEPTLAEGMISYLDDANRLDFYDGSAWKPVSKVLQVVQTVKTDTFTTSSSSYVDVTGLSATITPSSASSKVLAIFTVQGQGTNGAGIAMLASLRDSTLIGVGDAAGSRSRCSANLYTANNDVMESASWAVLDSPNTTSAVTYKVQMRAPSSTTIYLNRTQSDTDNAAFGRASSSITLMEVPA